MEFIKIIIIVIVIFIIIYLTVKRIFYDAIIRKGLINLDNNLNKLINEIKKQNDLLDKIEMNQNELEMKIEKLTHSIFGK